MVLRARWSWTGPSAPLAAQGSNQPDADSTAPLLPGSSQQQSSNLSIAALQQHCRSAGLSPYKLPRLVVPVPELPMNSSGKVLKQQLLRDLLQKQSSGSGGHGALGRDSSAGDGAPLVGAAAAAGGHSRL